MENKIEKIVELGIDIDNMNEEELFEDLGVDVISFVESPAIEEAFLYFNKEGAPSCDCGDHEEFVDVRSGENEEEFISRCMSELSDEFPDEAQRLAVCYSTWEEEEFCEECFDDLEDACKPGYKAIGLKPKNGRMVPNCVPVEAEEQFESYADYPESVRNNAKRGIELNEAVNNRCATQVGKVRAQQLAKGEAVSFETVKRMYSYLSRAEVYYDAGDKESCGYISYLLWGGKSAKTWAESKINQVEREDLAKKKKKKYTYDETVDMLLAYAEENGEFTTIDDIEVDLSKEEFTTVGQVLEGLGALDLLTRLNVKRGAEAETYYRYVGPPAERKFCKAMLRLANRGKIFTQQQIEAMNGLNPQFARSGESTYSVFEWVGGKNCRHYWQKLDVFKNESGNRVIIVSDASNAAQRNAARPWAQKMSQYAFNIDEDKRLVYGPVMIPNKMILRRDEEGNPFYVYFSKETIRKMAEKFLAQNKLHNTDIEHDDNVVTNNTLVESWVSDDMTHDKSYKLGFALPAGTWFAGYRVNDDQLWADIKAGVVKGFSLAGNFINRL